MAFFLLNMIETNLSNRFSAVQILQTDFLENKYHFVQERSTMMIILGHIQPIFTCFVLNRVSVNDTI